MVNLFLDIYYKKINELQNGIKQLYSDYADSEKKQHAFFNQKVGEICDNPFRTAARYTTDKKTRFHNYFSSGILPKA